MANNKWRIKEAVKIAEEAGLKALRTGAEAILTEAINEAPVDTGTLRRSGTVTVGSLPTNPSQIYQDARPKKEGGQEKEHKDAFPEPVGKEKAVYISFNTPYARRMHEDLGYTPKRGGGPKYLETPFNANKDKVLKMAETKVKKALEKAK
jgi:hypothetical protein